MFMFIIFVLFLSLAFWIFLNNMDDSVMDTFVTERIHLYNQSESIFDLVIDTVQRDLQCCGFRSSADWGPSFPASCCPYSCPDGVCLMEKQECLIEIVHTSSCLEMIRFVSLYSKYFTSVFIAAGLIFCSQKAWLV